MKILTKQLNKLTLLHLRLCKLLRF